MNILVVYATYSSGTLMAAHKIVTTLQQMGHTVVLKEAASVEPAEYGSHDLVIFGSPSWMVNNKDGMPHDHFVALMERTGDMSFEQKPFAVFGLGDETYMHFCGAVDKLEEYVKKMKGRLTGESLRLKDYFNNEALYQNLIEEWVNRIIHT